MITKFKIFENKKTPKFKVGDFVRIIKDEWKSDPYEIKKIDDDPETKRIYGYCYFLDTIKSGLIWRSEENLEFVPKYEVDAMKYNL